jgi:glutathione peroxidase
MKSIHEFSIESIDGGIINFADFKGKKIMIVNVASECGNTPQYADLELLYQWHGKNVVVVGIPCNDFGGQEPGTEADIKQFCDSKYRVTFPMTVKVDILKNTHPIYEFLTKKSENGLKDTQVTWNFQKYLLNRDGFLEYVRAPYTMPFDEYLIDWVVVDNWKPEYDDNPSFY